MLTTYRNGLRARAASVRAVYTFPETTLEFQWETFLQPGGQHLLGVVKSGSRLLERCERSAAGIAVDGARVEAEADQCTLHQRDVLVLGLVDVDPEAMGLSSLLCKRPLCFLIFIPGRLSGPDPGERALRRRNPSTGAGILARKRKSSEVWRRSLHPISALLPIRSCYAGYYAGSSFGTRSPSRIAKRCKAAFQFCTGMVHFLAICSNAR